MEPPKTEPCKTKKPARWVRRKLILVRVDESESESDEEFLLESRRFIEVEEPEGYRSEEY